MTIDIYIRGGGGWKLDMTLPTIQDLYVYIEIATWPYRVVAYKH